MASSASATSSSNSTALTSSTPPSVGGIPAPGAVLAAGQGRWDAPNFRTSRRLRRAPAVPTMGAAAGATNGGPVARPVATVLAGSSERGSGSWWPGPPATVGPLGVDAAIKPAWGGETVVEVDPIGTLVVDSHNARVGIPSDRRRRVRDDRRRPGVAAARRPFRGRPPGRPDQGRRPGAVVAVIGALMVGGLVLRSWRRGWWPLPSPSGPSGLYGLAALTFDPEASASRGSPACSVSPSTGRERRGHRIQLRRVRRPAGEHRHQRRPPLRHDAPLPTFAPDDDTIRLLHVSDLHLNPSAWDVIEAVAEQYDVDAIVDTGDIADHGTGPESATCDRSPTSSGRTSSSRATTTRC